MKRDRLNGRKVWVNGKLVGDLYDDEILVIRPKTPSVKELRTSLAEAVSDERYEEAARYRDQLKRLCQKK